MHNPAQDMPSLLLSSFTIKTLFLPASPSSNENQLHFLWLRQEFFLYTSHGVWPAVIFFVMQKCSSFALL